MCIILIWTVSCSASNNQDRAQKMVDISPEAGVSPATTSNQGDISQQRLKLLDRRSFILLDLGDLGREVVLGNGISGGNSYLSLSIYIYIHI